MEDSHYLVPFTSAIKHYKDSIIFLSSDSLICLNIENGEKTVEFPVEHLSAYYAYANKLIVEGDIVCLHTNKTLTCLNLQKKQVIKSVKMESNKAVRLHKRWLIHNNVLFVLIEEGLYFLSISSEEKSFQKVEIEGNEQVIQDINYCEGVGLVILTLSRVITLPVQIEDGKLCFPDKPVSLELKLRDNEKEITTFMSPYLYWSRSRKLLFLRAYSTVGKKNNGWILMIELSPLLKMASKFTCEELSFESDQLGGLSLQTVPKFIFLSSSRLFLASTSNILCLNI